MPYHERKRRCWDVKAIQVGSPKDNSGMNTRRLPEFNEFMRHYHQWKNDPEFRKTIVRRNPMLSEDEGQNTSSNPSSSAQGNLTRASGNREQASGNREHMPASGNRVQSAACGNTEQTVATRNREHTAATGNREHDAWHEYDDRRKPKKKWVPKRT